MLKAMSPKARILGVLVMALMLSGYTEKCTFMTAPHIEAEESSLVARPAIDGSVPSSY